MADLIRSHTERPPRSKQSATCASSPSIGYHATGISTHWPSYTGLRALGLCTVARYSWASSSFGIFFSRRAVSPEVLCAHEAWRYHFQLRWVLEGRRLWDSFPNGAPRIQVRCIASIHGGKVVSRTHERTSRAFPTTETDGFWRCIGLQSAIKGFG
jgi:hypothetical protein